ncbi:MAG: 16S rRNA (cytosine(1402)-N(4))-methyltransferase [Bacteroidetes bacterium]|nr:MAG: 16S rRNA (cytosine(1402)-N(4))-methyltransferase [Bacteroidota bacterium]
MYHNPVLLHRSIELLNIDPNGVYVDVTFGGGGHSRVLLQRLDGQGRLIAFDQDPDALNNVPDDDRFTLVPHNFRFLRNFLRLHQAIPVDGILADLGVSSHQFDVPDRGFSTRFDARLDMRMNPLTGNTAETIINSYSAEELQKIFTQYGELRSSYCVSRAIVKARADKPIQTTGQLIEVIKECLPERKINKLSAMVFQALRIEVNEELEVLKEMLTQAAEVLKPGGRLVVISYHSLEDRLVKNFFRAGNFEGKIEKDFYGNVLSPLKPLGGKAVIPNQEEIQENSRARSAKLRVAEKR